MNRTIQRLIDTGAPMQFKDGAGELSIGQYEKTTNISLPQDYREWLLFSNGSEIFVPGTVFYGVDSTAKNSLIEKNSQKERGLFAIGDSLLVIGRFNFGDLLCMDLNNGEIIQWDHETNEEFLRWNNFFDFIEEEITSFADEGV